MLLHRSRMLRWKICSTLGEPSSLTSGHLSGCLQNLRAIPGACQLGLLADDQIRTMATIMRQTTKPQEPVHAFTRTLTADAASPTLPKAPNRLIFRFTIRTTDVATTRSACPTIFSTRRTAHIGFLFKLDTLSTFADDPANFEKIGLTGFAATGRTSLSPLPGTIGVTGHQPRFYLEGMAHGGQMRGRTYTPSHPAR